MEPVVKHAADVVQDELVREYCKEAKELVMSAGSYVDAVRLKEEWCHRFQQECASALILNAAAGYLDRIIVRRWTDHETDGQ
jgi:hypothetical protein